MFFGKGLKGGFLCELPMLWNCHRLWILSGRSWRIFYKKDSDYEKNIIIGYLLHVVRYKMSQAGWLIFEFRLLYKYI